MYNMGGWLSPPSEPSHEIDRRDPPISPSVSPTTTHEAHRQPSPTPHPPQNTRPINSVLRTYLLNRSEYIFTSALAIFSCWLLAGAGAPPPPKKLLILSVGLCVVVGWGRLVECLRLLLDSIIT